jgi:ABC-type glycerol-3-phosphate transport system permease component
MPLISNVGRSAWRTRLLIAVLYLILVGGALTMLYPFGLMVANSFTSAADYEEFRLIPRFWHSDKMLFKKFVYDKVPITILGYEYGQPWYHTFDIKVDATLVDTERSVLDKEATDRTGKATYRTKVMKTVDPLGPYFAKDQAELNRIMDDWKLFLPKVAELHQFAYYGHTGTWNYSVLDLKPRYRAWLKARFGTIAALNAAYIDNAETFDDIGIPYEDPLRQRWLLPLDRKFVDWRNFKAELPIQKIWVVTAELAFQKFLRERYPDPNDLAKILGRPVALHADLTLPRAFGDRLLPPEVIGEFVHTKCPVIFLRLDTAACAEPYRAFIAEKYQKFPADFKALRLGTPLAPLCPMEERFPGEANDWIEFMEGTDLANIGFEDPMFNYQQSLQEKYRDVATLNAAYGWDVKDFRDIRLPAPWVDIYAFRQDKPTLFRTYLTGNYMMVFKVIAIHGRALGNTIFFVILAILGSLSINPLAAYALSRYRLRYTNKILLFLLATMAFPASVGMIPSFLLLKDLGLLNTFAALVLPGLANGYSIFLLKGFFDSLPQELYEAALIDGASEMTIFLRMALPLTKPILAIIALGAFTHAYSAFMFAFLTCQDSSMWTLMVFLYEFQQNYPNYLVMASLVISSIPTLLVFIFCQNIILRGIVVPSFK